MGIVKPAAVVAAILNEITMDFQDVHGAGLLMESINILRDQCEPWYERLERC
jgi:hypothetical protein